MKNKSIGKIGSLLFLIVALIGCDAMDPTADNREEDGPPIVTEEPPPPPPPVLPAEMFSVDLSLFETTPGKVASEPANYTHFLFAALRAGVVGIVNTTILAPPAFFTASLADVDPEYSQREGAYLWQKESSYLNSAHGLNLSARFVELNDDAGGLAVDWDMHVTGLKDENGEPTEDFLFFTAKTGLSSAEGSFELFYPIRGASVKMMEGDYMLDFEDQFFLRGVLSA